jgi:cytochrome o ubiquinol oxidase subunit II
MLLRVLPVLLLMVADSALAAEVNLPGGPQRDLLALAFYLMLIVFIPVIVMIGWFALHYRASNSAAAFRDEPAHAGAIELAVWIVPAILIFVLGTLVWKKTHELDPYRPLASGPPTEVQAVAQNWKWLFLYPDTGVASVNELAFPANRPLKLTITSDVAMNSFMIPALGGQIFAMAGMETELNLMAGQEGRFMGRNMQFSGAGFPEQRFAAIAMSTQDYEAWTEKLRNSPESLDSAAYAQLMRPTVDHPVAYYSAFEPDLFHSIVRRHRARDGMR